MQSDQVSVSNTEFSNNFLASINLSPKNVKFLAHSADLDIVKIQ